MDSSLVCRGRIYANIQLLSVEEMCPLSSGKLLLSLGKDPFHFDTHVCCDFGGQVNETCLLVCSGSHGKVVWLQ